MVSTMELHLISVYLEIVFNDILAGCPSHSGLLTTHKYSHIIWFSRVMTFSWVSFKAGLS